MNRTDHLLDILAEECNEVALRVSKALRFGLDEIQPGQTLTNRQRIMAEVNDLYAALKMLGDDGVIDPNPAPDAVQTKVAKVEAFLVYSAKCGRLDTDLAPEKPVPVRLS